MPAPQTLSWPADSGAWLRRQDAPPPRGVATEVRVLDKGQQERSGEKFLPLPPEACCTGKGCPYMRLETVEKLSLSLAGIDREQELHPAPPQLIGPAQRTGRETG